MFRNALRIGCHGGASRAREMAMRALPPALTSRFGGVPVAASTLQRLLAGGVRTPLPIQAAAMPRILMRESLAIHAETGSGKTLAYLLPLLARLVPDEPRQVLVVVPSMPLALQTVRVARLLAPSDVRVGLMQRTRAATQPETVLVTTGKDLGGLLPMLLRDGRQLQHELRKTLQAVVVDEPDAIFAPPRHRRREDGGEQIARRRLALALALALAVAVALALALALTLALSLSLRLTAACATAPSATSG